MVGDKIQKFINLRINEDAVNIEKVHFTKTDRIVNPKKVNPFLYLKGTVPILVSAPHSVRHYRQKKIKKSDEFTGSLAYILNQLTGCHSLAVTKLYGGDPNWDWPCLYKELLYEICRKNKIIMVLDLHGAAREHDFDIDIGDARGASVLNKTSIKQFLFEKFDKYGIRNLSFNHFPAEGENTVTGYVYSKLKIPAVQLEINKKFRVPHQNPNSYASLVAALVDIINVLAIPHDQ